MWGRGADLVRAGGARRVNDKDGCGGCGSWGPVVARRPPAVAKSSLSSSNSCCKKRAASADTAGGVAFSFCGPPFSWWDSMMDGLGGD